MATVHRNQDKKTMPVGFPVNSYPFFGCPFFHKMVSLPTFIFYIISKLSCLENTYQHKRPEVASTFLRVYISFNCELELFSVQNMVA